MYRIRSAQEQPNGTPHGEPPATCPHRNHCKRSRKRQTAAVNPRKTLTILLESSASGDRPQVSDSGFAIQQEPYMTTRRITGMVGTAIALAISVSVCAQSGPQQPTWVTANSDRNPTVSPDGKRLVFQSDRSGRRALYSSSVTGEDVSVLLDSGDEPRYAAWSPRGDQIAFAANVGGEDDIFVMNVDGTDRRRLTTHPARDGHPRWSADGRRIFFNSERVADEPEAPKTGEDVVDIFSIKPDGSDLMRHTWCRSECSYPSLSPDGTTLLYRRVFWESGDESERIRNSEIVIANFDGSNERNLTNDLSYDVYPIWSHDGRWIYFSSVRSQTEPRMHLWRVSASGGPAQQITTGDWNHRQAVPDRQGSKIYLFQFARVDGVDIGHIAAIDVPAESTP